MNIYAVISIGLFLGLVAHLLIALQTINTNTPKTNFGMVWKMYWQTDYLLFAISIMGCVIYLYTLSEWMNLNKLDTPQPGESAADKLLHFKFALFVKSMSVVVGAFADYLVFKFWSKTKKAIDKKFDDDKNI